VLATYARRRPLRAILIAFLIVALVDFSADDGCGCDDFAPRHIVSTR